MNNRPRFTYIPDRSLKRSPEIARARFIMAVELRRMRAINKPMDKILWRAIKNSQQQILNMIESVVVAMPSPDLMEKWYLLNGSRP